MRRRVALVLLLAALAATVVFSTWIGAQARAVIVLGQVLETPVLTDVAGALTREPRESEEVVAGVPTSVYRPGRGSAWPAIVFVNGVTRRGRHHATVRRLARALARSGYLTLVPDPPGLGVGELTTRTLARLVAVAEAATRRSDADGRIAFIGVSAGGSLGLLAASNPLLCRRVTVIAAVAPYTDLVDVVRLATTGSHVERGVVVRYRTDPFVGLVAARSLAAALPRGPDRSTLLEELRRVPDASAAPLARFRAGRPGRLGPRGRALTALLANRDPRRFDALFAALPPSVRAASRRLSPILVAPRLCAPVELLSGPHDKYFPPAESRALVRVAPHARLTISSTLQHVDLHPSVRGLADLARLDGVVVRTLRAAR